MKKPLILMVSESMDSNQKDNRNEKGLVRMSQNVRDYMGFESQVELWPETENPVEGKIKQAVLLQIFHSFKKDVRRIKELVNKGELSEDDSKRVGFVTKDVYDRVINGSNNGNDVWISETIEDIPTGADPEFMLLNDKGEVPYAGLVSGFSYYAALGSDGPLAELRPEPSTTVEGFVKNLSILFNNEELTDPIKDLKWMSGCYHHDGNRAYPIGGHIHAGNPIQINNIGINDRETFFRALNKIIDEYLSLPMIRLDGTKGNDRRCQSTNGRYGWFGEMRMASGRLEHRTLSGIWLSHPDLTGAVVGTAKAIIEETYRFVSDKKFSPDYMLHQHLKSPRVFDIGFDSWDEIPLTKDLRCVRSSAEMHKLLNDSDTKQVNIPFIKKWYEEIKMLSTYEQYSSSIDRLYDILKAPNKKLMSLNLNLRENWVEGREFDI